MKVIYDISVLGLSNVSHKSRTGVYRVVENIGIGLALSQDIQLDFSSSYSTSEFNSFYTHDSCSKFLKSHPELDRVPFIHTAFQKNYYKFIDQHRKNFDQKAKNKNSPFALKTLYKFLSKQLRLSAKISEQVISYIPLKKIEEADIYHASYLKIPQQVRKYKKPKKFLTVYDLIPILYPNFFDLKSNQKHYLNEVIDSLDFNDWAICISQATKNDLCEYKKIDPSRVFVSHLAADNKIFYPCTSRERKSQVLQKYNIPDAPYFLGLSTLEPRKNIAHTIRCFIEMVEQEKIEDLNLVLVGAKGWKYQEIFDNAACNPQLADRIIFTNYVADEDLASIYSNALAFVYMSFYEGFGLPPLEAMNCGTPVITSNTSSLPEVVGNAGIMLPPSDRDQLCHQLLQVYKNDNLREKLSIQALDRSKLFSWDKSCQEVIKAYKTALSE